VLRDRNLDLLARVAERLLQSSEEFVFVGGAIVGLLTTDPAIETPRPTDDVDAIVQVASYADYDQRLAPELRRLGLTEDIEARTICRWLLDGVKVDVMPTDSRILGFTNRWYVPAVANAMTVSLAGLTIRVVSSPYSSRPSSRRFRTGEGTTTTAATTSRTSSPSSTAARRSRPRSRGPIATSAPTSPRPSPRSSPARIS
jgi:hypothetical protein